MDDSMDDGMTLTDKIYEECLGYDPQHLFTGEELVAKVPGKDFNLLKDVVNDLMSRGLMKTLKQGDSFVYRLLRRDEAAKIKTMTPDEAMIYSHIESAGREGIWTKTLKARTNLHQSVVNRCLKTLENAKYIKAIKAVKYPARKIYMLYDLSPSIDVTGGPWFTDSELDQDFINELLAAILKYIGSRSYPKQKVSHAALTPYPPSYAGYPTLSEIAAWVKNSNLTEVELVEADIRSLLEVLVYDGKVGRVVGKTAYKMIRKGEMANGFTEAPCGKCPVFDLCHEGGPVSASTCVYFEDWLEQF